MSSISSDAQFRAYYYSLPFGDRPRTHQASVGDGGGLALVSAEGSEYTFSSSLGSVTSSETFGGLSVFEFTYPGEFVFSSPQFQENITFIVTQ